MSRLSVRSPENWRAYDLWNLIIALVLAITAIWVWIKHDGLSAGDCCGGSAASMTATAAAGGASWDADGRVTLSGVVKDDASRKRIVEAAAAKYGVGNVADQLRVDRGFSTSVVLTGEVASIAEKNARSEWARSIYGAAVAINNQLVVKAPSVVPPPNAATRATPATEKIYFLTANTEIDQRGRASIARVVEHLKEAPNAKAVISGFHDSRGNKAQNELLAKDRAKGVRDELRAAGIDEARIVMRKPQETTGTGDLAEARRVELSVE